MKRNIVIFDLDGTLLDTLDDLTAATNWALTANGLPVRSRDEVRQFVGNGVRKLMERAVPNGTGNPAFEKAFVDFKNYYVEHCRDNTAPYPGVLDLLRKLRAAGFRIAIVSNKLQAGVTELQKAMFADLVDVAVGERPGVRRKPAPDMIETALRELHATAEEAVYVGDSDVDIETAKNSGLPCISVLWGFRDHDFLVSHGATVFAERPENVFDVLDKPHIYLITGGQRSGKSQFAEHLALSLSPNPVYMATAHIWDDEFRKRVLRHQERRGPEWTNIEEERNLSHYDVSGRVVLVDCLTLWATNYFFADGKEIDINEALDALKTEFDYLTAQPATFIFVTNEIGLGGTPANDVQRRFTDLLGSLNQYVAERADEVVLMVSGLPVYIKRSCNL